MANSVGTMTTSSALLKSYFTGLVKDQFNSKVMLYGAAEQGKEPFYGSQVVRSLRVLRNNGIGAGSDGGALPSTGTQGMAQATIQAKFNWLRFAITSGLVAASKSDKGAFAQAFANEVKFGVDDFKADQNRALFWNGEGRLAVLSAAAVASTVITVTGRTSGEAGNKYLAPGMVIDIVNPTTGVVSASGITISSISGTTTATVVLNAAVTCAASDIIVRTGAYNKEVQGIRTILDGLTTTVYGIDRSLYNGIYNGTVADASGGQLTLDLMQQTVNAIRQKGGEMPDAIFCDFSAERAYAKLLTANIRFVERKAKVDGSFTAASGQSYLDFAGIPVVPDKDCPGFEFIFFKSDGWKKYVLEEMTWADETGSQMISIPGVDAWESRCRLFYNMFPEKPANLARLTNFISP